MPLKNIPKKLEKKLRDLRGFRLQRGTVDELRGVLLEHLKNSKDPLASMFRSDNPLEKTRILIGKDKETFSYPEFLDYIKKGGWGTHQFYMLFAECFGFNAHVKVGKAKVEYPVYTYSKEPETPKLILIIEDEHWTASESVITLGDGNCFFYALAQELNRVLNEPQPIPVAKSETTPAPQPMVEKFDEAFIAEQHRIEASINADNAAKLEAQPKVVDQAVEAPALAAATKLEFEAAINAAQQLIETITILTKPEEKFDEAFIAEQHRIKASINADNAAKLEAQPKVVDQVVESPKLSAATRIEFEAALNAAIQLVETIAPLAKAEAQKASDQAQAASSIIDDEEVIEDQRMIEASIMRKSKSVENQQPIEIVSDNTEKAQIQSDPDRQFAIKIAQEDMKTRNWQINEDRLLAIKLEKQENSSAHYGNTGYSPTNPYAFFSPSKHAIASVQQLQTAEQLHGDSKFASISVESF